MNGPLRSNNEGLPFLFVQTLSTLALMKRKIYATKYASKNHMDQRNDLFVFYDDVDECIGEYTTHC